MSELRRDPRRDEWLIVAPQRQDRTYHPPPDHCPLCPTRPGGQSGEIPEPDFDIAVFENRFPGLRRDEPGDPRPTLDRSDPPLLARAAGLGQAEVVVYTPEHRGSLGSLDLDRVERLIRVWTHRYAALSAREEVRHIFIFENRGPEIGVTLEHPHGQIYAYPFIPPIPARELDVEARHHRRTGRCLGCDLIAAELDAGERVVVASDHVVAHVPFAPRWPYELHLSMRPHRHSLPRINSDERHSLAALLRAALAGYDRLFDRPMPYILAIRQAPTASTPGPGSHLRIELYPALRARDRLKHRAGSETAMGVTVTDVAPERAAERLRQVVTP